jgi:hypothetical protein
MTKRSNVLGSLMAPVLALAPLALWAQTDTRPAPASNAVTVDNFPRAETDMYLRLFVKCGAFGGFYHFRDLAPIKGTGVRPNRDTLYSEAVFDLDAGPVTITMPEAGRRFMSIMAVNEDYDVLSVGYGGGAYTYTKAKAGTRYLFVAVRILVDVADPSDVDRAHALQGAITVSQPGGPGRFEVSDWDPVSQKKVRDALVSLGATLPDLRRAFSASGQVDPVRHLIGTAIAWGGNPDKDAIYLNVTPAHNDGTTIYRMNIKDVPVDGFWSISVYDAHGYFVPNALDAYTLNSITSKKSSSGTIAIQFGGCDGKVPNCLPVPPDWNYMVRLYRPRADALEGSWSFPQAYSVGASATATAP